MLRSRRRHAQELVNRCDSRATPGRPPQPPVAKSAGSEHVAAGAPRRADSIRSLRPTKRAKATEGFACVKPAQDALPSDQGTLWRSLRPTKRAKATEGFARVKPAQDALPSDQGTLWRSLRPTKRAKATEGFARVKSALLHRSRRHHGCALRQGLHPQPVDDPHQLFEPHLVEMA